MALLEASIQAKTGNGAAADQTLTAVQGDDSSGLRAILMRAQMAASDGNVAQVSAVQQCCNPEVHMLKCIWAQLMSSV